jgi:DNA polymerase I-like protein with 3'-5' exonuclease and polymerase domains
MGFPSQDVVTVDFETMPIARRPDYPPVPVGVAIKLGDRKGKYYAWGHPSGGNNCSWGDARRILGEYYDSGRPILFHNGINFDIEVGEVHMQLPKLPWDQVHDTLPMLFLRDPHAKSLALKPSSEDILGIAPDERDEVIEWLIAKQLVPGVRLNDKPKGKNYAGKHIYLVPGDIGGRYAVGDVDRTWALADVIYDELDCRGMLEAYDRERRLAPHLRVMEQQGIRVDVERLGRDVARYQTQMEMIDQWIRVFLKGGDTLNIDSGADLAHALVKAKKCKEEDFGVTPTGKMQTNKAALTGAIKDQHLLSILTYRAQLKTCLGTFMKPWLETAQGSGGFIYTGWNSTRSTESHLGKTGARTGRLSSKPTNLQNIPTGFDPLFWSKDNPHLPKCNLNKPLLPLPLVRSYVIPYEENHVLIGRDYSQQELRAMGHFEGGVLCEAYNKDPWLDVHDFALHLINDMVKANFNRKQIKGTGFGLLYGMGIGLLAERIGVTVEVAKKVKAAYLETFPGLGEMYKEMKRRAAAHEPIRTWGGREYYCEEPKWNAAFGRWQTFDYKMVNVLIQGSSGDCTKEAMIRYMDAMPGGHKCLLTVHDELCASVPREELHKGMDVMRTAMESVEFDVPMLSEGSWSDKNWAVMKAYDKKGKLLCRLPNANPR